MKETNNPREVEHTYPDTKRVTILFKDKTQIIKEGSGLSLRWVDGLAGYTPNATDEFMWNMDLIESLSLVVLTWKTYKVRL